MTPSLSRTYLHWLWVFAPIAFAAVAYVALRPPSADLAAQMFRSELFASHGFLIWNNYWYGGHYVLGYSLLFPPLGAALGTRVVGGLAAVAAALLFGMLVRRRYPATARLATLWLGAGAIAMVLSGRLTFALGVAIGLGALLALDSGRLPLAGLLAAATSCASPVAGFFLLLFGGALALSGGRVKGAVLGISAAAPVALMAVFFPLSGEEPFVLSSLVGTLAVSLLVWALLPRREAVLRRGVGLYALAVLCVFTVPNALGGNVVRLSNLAAGPLLALAMSGPRRRLALAVLAVPLLYWQWQPAIRDVSGAMADPSVQRSFYAPLLAQLRERTDGVPVRIEVPPTQHRWEARYIAPHFPLARGWERQSESEDFTLFKGRNLSAAAYRAWLRAQGASYVALADAPLDYLARREAALVRRGLPYLTPVWSNEDWRLYAVRGAQGIADDGVRLTSLGPDRFGARVTRPGRFLLRIHFNSYWVVAGTGACLRAKGPWTLLEARRPGPVRATTQLSPGSAFGEDRVCSAAGRASYPAPR